MPKYEQIVQFIEVYHEKSITKAASNLFVTQQSLSHNIKRLEEDLGHELFVRSARGVTPTEAGERLYSTFYPIVCSFQNAMDQFTERYAENVIAFATTPAVIRNLTPNTLMAFCKSHPVITVEMKAVQDKDLEKFIFEDPTHFGIVTAPECILRERYECIKLKTESMSLLVNENNPLAQLPVVDLTELRDQNFLNIRHGFFYIEALNRITAPMGFTVTPFFESDDMSNLLNMVEYGSGVMLCRNALYETVKPKNCKLIPIENRAFEVCTAIIFQNFSLLPELTKSYIRFLVEEVASASTDSEV